MSGESRSLLFLIGVCCMVGRERNEVGKNNVGKCLAIQMWSPNSAKVCLKPMFRFRKVIYTRAILRVSTFMERR